MMTVDESIASQSDPAADAFYKRAYQRIQTTILAGGVVVSIPIYVRFGWRVGTGFLIGAAIAYLNFLWLKQSIIALTDRVAAQETGPQGRVVVFKFLFRYGIIGAAAYAIISSSTVSVYGVIAGFFLSVAALFTEAVTEVVYALRHGD